MSAQPVSFPVPHQPAFFSQKTLTWCTTACFPSDHSSHQHLKLDYKVLSFASNLVCLLPFVLWIHRGILSPGAGSPWIAVSALFLDMPAHILTEILRHRARHPFSSSPCCCFSLVSLRFYRRAHIHSCSPPVTSQPWAPCSLPACSAPLSLQLPAGAALRGSRGAAGYAPYTEKQSHTSLLHHLLELHHDSKSSRFPYDIHLAQTVPLRRNLCSGRHRRWLDK